MIRIIRALLRSFRPQHKNKNSAAITESSIEAALADIWVNSRGKPIGAKRSRQKRQERQRIREHDAIARDADKALRRGARY